MFVRVGGGGGGGTSLPLTNPYAASSPGYPTSSVSAAASGASISGGGLSSYVGGLSAAFPSASAVAASSSSSSASSASASSSSASPASYAAAALSRLSALSSRFQALPLRTRLVVVAAACVAVIVLLYMPSWRSSGGLAERPSGSGAGSDPARSESFWYHPSNDYTIMLIADHDKRSRHEESWRSTVMLGTLSYDSATGQYSVSWSSERTVKSKMNEAGRGVELSDLVWFAGHMYTCDDRTGILFEVRGDALVPRVIMNDGDGHTDKGFKCEWLTVKDGHLVAGSTGKEFTTPTGQFLNNNPMWVKVIDTRFHVRSENWLGQYQAMRVATDTTAPGYLIHEAMIWDGGARRWIVLPRRVSQEAYDDVADERRGSNRVLIANEDFSKIDVVQAGDVVPSHGFSSAKLVPGRSNHIVALKTEEDGDTIATYIMVFDRSGRVLLPETKCADAKLEGVEFVPKS